MDGGILVLMEFSGFRVRVRDRGSLQIVAHILMACAVKHLFRCTLVGTNLSHMPFAADKAAALLSVV
jgi:hypothetical protein